MCLQSFRNEKTPKNTRARSSDLSARSQAKDIGRLRAGNARHPPSQETKSRVFRWLGPLPGGPASLRNLKRGSRPAFRESSDCSARPPATGKRTTLNTQGCLCFSEVSDWAVRQRAELLIGSLQTLHCKAASIERVFRIVGQPAGGPANLKILKTQGRPLF